MDAFATLHVVSSLILFISTFTTNLGFNVDTSHPLIFSNDDGEGTSYFGFSVALHKNQIGSYLLAGAPRSNASFFHRASAGMVKPGAVYKCLLSDVNRQCQQIPFLRNTDNGIKNEYKFKDLWENSWLGGSLDVASVDKNPAIAACAHLWKNQRYPGHHLTNGMCFTIDSDLISDSIGRLMPMSQHSKQSLGDFTYQYSYGLAGMASHFVKGTADLAIGAPGVVNWTGTVAYVKETHFKKEIDNQRFIIPSPLSDAGDSYVGYSVSSGSFFNAGEKVQLVAGAPRYGTTGAVFVFEVPLPQDTYFTNVLKKKLEGKQMGEYFGAAVCAVDLNNDQYADLLVGAPSHSVHVDEGLVYVFMNTKDETLLSIKSTLAGPQRGARFGSAISAVGDLNQDGYQDVVIGAPYESGQGAVYVYHGSKHGPKLMQKILGSDVDSRLRGFGISISRGLDIDENNVADFAVGSYETGYAAVFRTYPVIELKSTVEFSISQVNLHNANCSVQSMKSTCFTVTTCTTYSGLQVPSSAVLTQTFMIGSKQHTESRGYIIVGGDPDKKSKYDITLNANEPSCKEYEVHVLNSTQDVLTPLSFELTSEVTRNPRLEREFCSNCPLLDSDNTTISAEISFVTNCGEDDVCNTDLGVKAEISGLKDTSFIIGSSDDMPVVLKVEVTNSGEAAYMTMLEVSLPPEVMLARKLSNCEENFQPDGFTKMLCVIGNPLPENNNVLIEFLLDMNEIPTTMQEINFAFNVSTISVDKNTENNFISISLPVTAEADITIIPSTDTEQLMLPLQKKTANATANSTFIYHNFKIMKYGYSPINSVTAFINIPIQFEDSNNPFVEIMSIEAFYDGVPIEECQKITNSSIHTDSYNDANTFRTSLRLFEGKTLALDCESSQCTTVFCSFGPFIDQETADVKIGMKVYTQQLESVLEYRDQIMLISYGKVLITDRNLIQPADQHADLAEATTEFYKYGAPAPRQVANWIIPVCIAAGLLFLLLIILILAKLGFFRRTQKEKMDELAAHENEDLLEKKENTSDDNTTT